MCQAKITDHYGGKYKCLRPDKYSYEVTIEYGFGYLKGKVKKYVRTLCEKHAKIFRYNNNRKREKGHKVTLNETLLNKEQC